MRQVCIIGGGAAGMMAAISAARSGAKVTLFEKNEKLGKKLYITGKGRCNVTNACDSESYFTHLVHNPRFMFSSFHSYNNYDVMQDLESWGVPLKTERGERVFPQSDRSSDILAALNRALQKLHVSVYLHTEVKGLLTEELADPPVEPEIKKGKKKKKGPSRKITGVLLADNTRILADAVIVATGGVSYAATGSTGDGYRFAKYLGISVVEPVPSLVPFETAESFCRELQGLALKNVSLTMTAGKKELYSGFGEMLFTHFGVSGPLVLTASCYYHGPGEYPITLHIDLKPALTREQLDNRLLREFEIFHGKQFKNALVHLYPSSLIPIIISESGIAPDKKVSEISREDREKLIEKTKNLTLTVTGTRPFSEAIITQGGVSVKEISPSTMECRDIADLYFAGEVLDVDAHTGGFNLQIAWSSGHAAGKAAAEKGKEV